MHATLLTLWLALFALLVGCRSDPVHYHTLSPLAVTPSPESGAVQALHVERVTVPPQVDRSQIVLRQGANHLVILETDWWGANLADELQNALTNQIAVRPDSANKALVRVHVQRFDLVPGQYALLEAKWRIRAVQPGGQEPTELTCQTMLRTRSGASVEDLVVAQQENLRQLASAISTASQTGARRCPPGPLTVVLQAQLAAAPALVAQRPAGALPAHRVRRREGLQRSAG